MIVQRFEEVVVKYKNKVALKDDGNMLTYDEYNTIGIDGNGPGKKPPYNHGSDPF
jgi:hypothetical protein